MHITSEQLLDADVLERTFTLGDIDGFLWTPASASAPMPLVLLGPPPLALSTTYPRLAARARGSIADGFAAATIELPGNGPRPPLPIVDQARKDMRAALQSCEPVSHDIVDRLVLPLVGQAVPEWQTLLDALLARPDIGGPVAWSGGVISIATRLAMIDPRIKAAVLFAGSFVPRVTFEEARRVTIPLHVLLQWDDEGNDRQMSLDLFDAFASGEKTLSANMGGHTGVPPYAGREANRFLSRHLR
jgi:hypothetical protein